MDAKYKKDKILKHLEDASIYELAEQPDPGGTVLYLDVIGIQ
jgi:hypothetical protein